MSDYGFQVRHIEAGGQRTTLALEGAFWRHLDRLAGNTGWRSLVGAALADRPAGISKSRWLRVVLLDRVSQAI
jgi:predicted DNA-binding ribbon-helix-helix protein